MSANTSTRSRYAYPQAFCPLSFLSVVPVACYYCCFVTLLILSPFSGSSLGGGSNALVTPAQTTTAKPPTTITEQYPAYNLSVIQPKAITTTTTGAPALTSNNNPSLQPQQQPKSLKFTLIAGKLWRFNIKANSFSSHKEGELRLHKNFSTNNYIIDDDGWFQYNPQQQQLFAWPSLATKPGTYHFVLLPSGVDFEADSENVVNLDVAASIVVELIRPLYLGGKTDIDQLIDHKFSLDYLHRHSSYPLLMNQILSVFELLSSRSNNTSQQQQSLLTTTTPVTITALLAQQKGSKLTNKLSEYLLISSTYSSDGELFSLTWSTHPTLANNTITPINECRLTTISDIVTKLSGLSSAYQSGDESVIYYPLDAPLVNSQAIVPTERGNFALKLTLNGPCQKSKIIEELGIVPSSRLNNGPVVDTDDKENNIVDPQSVPPTLSKVISVTPHPGLPAPEAIDSNTAIQPITTKSPPASSTSTTTTTTITTTTSTTTNQGTRTSSSTVSPTTSVVLTDSKYFKQSARGLTTATTEETTPTLTGDKVNKTVLETQVLKSEGPPALMQPQAKSFANFLDSADVQSSSNNTMSSTSVEEGTNENYSTQSSLNLTTGLPIVVSIVKSNTKDANSTVSESSLNEDFMDILNDVMDYLVSVAVPISVVIGVILLISIFIALCSLRIKRKKSKQFQVRNRFNFRYGSERRAFLKNSSKPVILDADQKSISMGGTPQHRPSKISPNYEQYTSKANSDGTTYLPMHQFTATIEGNVTSNSAHTNCGDAPPERERKNTSTADPIPVTSQPQTIESLAVEEPTTVNTDAHTCCFLDLYNGSCDCDDCGDCGDAYDGGCDDGGGGCDGGGCD